jgi:hypothetical protein
MTWELANKIQGGAEIIVHTVRAVLESDPSWCCVKTDSVNAFNSLDRAQVSAIYLVYHHMWISCLVVRKRWFITIIYLSPVW